MEENQEKQTNKSRKGFIFGAIALVVLLLIISVAEIISINSMNSQIKAQQQELDRLTNELKYYKEQASETNDEFFEGAVQ